MYVCMYINYINSTCRYIKTSCYLTALNLRTKIDAKVAINLVQQQTRRIGAYTNLLKGHTQWNLLGKYKVWYTLLDSKYTMQNLMTRGPPNNSS